MQDTLLQALKEILHHRKTNDYFAKKLGVTVEEIQWAREELKKQGYVACKMTKDSIQQEVAEESILNSFVPMSQFAEDCKSGTAEATFLLEEPIRTLDELIEKCKIDTNRWTIYKYVQNFWGSADSPRYQVKAWMEEKKADKHEAIIHVLKNYKSTFQPLTPDQLHLNTKYDRPTLAYIALTDVHIDKIEHSKLTMDQKVEQYKRILQALVLKTYGAYYLDEIVYTIGHDWFNTDTYHSTTTNGTPQFNSAEWNDSYEKAFDLQVWAISFMKQFCNRLVIKFVPGNHDRTKTYFMVHALDQHFKTDTSITFDRTADSTKCHTYGEVFIGMHHGDTKIEDLPLYCAQKYYKEWGQCRYHEIGVGDKHHKKQYKLRIEDTEVQGTRLFMTPSMGGHGKWDRERLYDNSIQAGICRLYDKEYGKCGEFEERIQN